MNADDSLFILPTQFYYCWNYTRVLEHSCLLAVDSCRGVE